MPALREAGGAGRGHRHAGSEYRLATDAPEVQLAVSDPEEGADWFNLDVRVSIEGEPVEYRELFTALATGQTHLILPSGTWFSLERPELEQLRGR